MPVIITELLGRAEAGVSVTPYRCRTEDGREIFVKPYGSHPTSLIHEWIGGKLAACMSLPMAEIELIEVPKALADANQRPEWSSFKSGIGFGSYHGGRAYRDLQTSDLPKLDAVQLAETMLFDYWIQNQDRQMGAVTGNPNTMVHFDRNEFYLIDHDNAFDENFDLLTFLQLHIGREQRNYFHQTSFQSAWLKKVESCLSHLDDFWQDLPDEWVYSDLDTGTEPRYTLAPLKQILERPLTDAAAFWNRFLP